jgi:hypothetical protein
VPQQEGTTAAVVTTAAIAAPMALPAQAPAGGDRAAVVEIPGDDAPSPGWSQWGNWPTPTPEPTAGVLVMQEDGRVMP